MEHGCARMGTYRRPAAPGRDPAANLGAWRTRPARHLVRRSHAPGPGPRRARPLRPARSRPAEWPLTRRHSPFPDLPPSAHVVPRGRSRSRRRAAARDARRRARTRERVVAHLGPTNSGKTHAALEILAAARPAATAARCGSWPRRSTSGSRDALGEDAAGLITGEERINPDGGPSWPAPRSWWPRRDVVVIDEVHWLADRDRGSAWTRALLTLPCRELHLVGSADILPALRAAFPDLEVRAYDRLAPLALHRDGPDASAWSRAPRSSRSAARRSWRSRGTCRVAHPGRVGVLYGAMPLGERGARRRAFRDGRARRPVRHGCPGPRPEPAHPDRAVRGVGQVERHRARRPGALGGGPDRGSRRSLRDARRGRRGHPVGPPLGHAARRVIKAGLHPRPDREGLPTFRRLTTMNLGPAFADVAHAATETLAHAAAALGGDRARAWWPGAAGHVAARRGGRLDGRAGCRALGRRTLRSLPPGGRLDVRAGPVEPRDESRPDRPTGQGGPGRRRPCATWWTFSGLEHATSAEAEDVADRAAVLRWFTRRCPDAGGITARGRRPAGVARHGGRRSRPGSRRSRPTPTASAGPAASPPSRAVPSATRAGGRSGRAPVRVGPCRDRSRRRRTASGRPCRPRSASHPAANGGASSADRWWASRSIGGSARVHSPPGRSWSGGCLPCGLSGLAGSSSRCSSWLSVGAAPATAQSDLDVRGRWKWTESPAGCRKDCPSYAAIVTITRQDPVSGALAGTYKAPGEKTLPIAGTITGTEMTVWIDERRGAGDRSGRARW